MRRFSCWSSSFDVGIRSRSSARNDARKRSSGEGGSSSVKARAAGGIRARTGTLCGTAGFLPLSRALGAHALPAYDQVGGLREADDEGGETGEGEGGARDDAGVQDRTPREHGHRIECGSEPIEGESELEHAEDANPGNTEREAPDPGIRYARGQVGPPERRDQAAEEQELTEPGREREDFPHLRHRQDDDLSDPSRIQAEAPGPQVQPHSEEGKEQPTAGGSQARARDSRSSHASTNRLPRQEPCPG